MYTYILHLFQLQYYFYFSKITNDSISLTICDEDQIALIVMDFPPDLKPTEHVVLVEAEHSVASQEASWVTVKSCWNNTSQQVLHRLVESTPAQVNNFIVAKGDNTPNSMLFWNFSNNQLFTKTILTRGLRLLDPTVTNYIFVPNYPWQVRPIFTHTTSKTARSL